jgi:sporulation protein YlmC with PRC-barrel domain
VGGFWGIGDEELIVPLDKFQLNQRRDYVFFNGTESELKAFPEYQAPVWGRGRYDSAYRGRMYYGPPAMYTVDPYYDGDRRTMQRMHPRDRANRYDSGWNHYEDMVPRYGMRGYYHDGTMGSRAYPNDGRRTYGERYDGRWDENGGRRANDNARRGDAEQQDRWYGNRRTDFKSDQNQNRLKASDLIGMSVKNARGETIGEVDDILVASNGRMDLLISVGEFLGMGGKQIRADLKDVELDDPDFVFYDISNREMENQPAYQADER